MVDVSVIIVCMNRPDNLYPCLQSIAAHADESLSVETIVVAYLYDKSDLETARKDFPWVRFIESNQIRGFAENNNLALRSANGRYCFILNDDTVLPDNVIGRLFRDFNSLPEDTAIITPKLVNEDGSLQLLGRNRYFANQYVRRELHIWEEPADNAPYNSGIIFETYGICGAAFLIRTSVFRRLGWFDDTYFFTPEDVALADKAMRAGYRIFCDREAVVVHKWRGTSSSMAAATRPAAVRGCLIYFSDGIGMKYILIALPVFLATFLKYVKAMFSGNKLKRKVFWNVLRSIFTRRTPKDIFKEYYNELKVR